MKSLKQISKWDLAIVAIIIVTILGLWIGGCQMPNVQPETIRNLADQTQQLSSQIDDFQQQTKATLEALKENGNFDSNTMATIEKLQSGIDSVQGKTVAIADALRNAQYTNPDDGLTTVLEGARAANAASSPFNPYAPLIDVGLGLAAAFAAAMAKKNARKAAEALAKYDAHKQGVELTMKQVSQSTVPEVKAVETQLYQNIGEARKTKLGS
jgi:outer membrane lipoprotein-sorting protein